MAQRKVLVTGHKGYIGPHVVRLLKEAGYWVTACDVDLFSASQIDEVVQPDLELIKDFRNLTVRDLEGYDTVIHLAAISNDPMGDLNKDITYQINREGSIYLAQLALKAGVRKFLFSSSCSIYGKAGDVALDESAVFNPQTAYAISKVAVEDSLRTLANDHFSPCYLRNSTAYGLSPYFRIDLVVNNLLACALAKGSIRIMSDGSPWRPLIHCKDIARAFVLFTDAPVALIHNKAVNIGANTENYQVRGIADMIQEFVPNAQIVFTGEVGSDSRDYQVNFNLLYALFPHFQLEYTLKTGIEELYNKLQAINFSLADFESDRFVRLKLLQKNLHKIIK
ncbi:MAG: SDR family oxidoreductase [Phycisphaerales bacterium]|nr:SDR family oxidoreductase [Phycisphaerales bacterium]